MMGYPGAGKTTTARIISELTGAVHIWTDHERKKLFGHPTHSEHESSELYRRLNAYTDTLLNEGKSVIFDTSFNHFRDRSYMRTLAERHGARVVIIWVQTPKELAKSRALSFDHARNNQYHTVMSPQEFGRIADNLELPATSEAPIALDGTRITKEYVRQELGL
jgi:predicted kinase